MGGAFPNSVLDAKLPPVWSRLGLGFAFNREIFVDSSRTGALEQARHPLNLVPPASLQVPQCVGVFPVPPTVALPALQNEPLRGTIPKVDHSLVNFETLSTFQLSPPFEVSQAP